MTLKWQAHSDSVYCVKVLTNGNLISGSRDSTLIVWNITDNPPIQVTSFTYHSNEVFAVEQLLDGSVVSAGGDMNLYLWDSNTGQFLSFTYNAHSKAIYCLKALPNGNFASGSGDSSIKIWDPSSMSSPLLTLTDHTGPVLALEVILDDYLLSGSDDTYSYLWNFTSGTMIEGSRPVNDQEITCIKELPSSGIVFAGNDPSIYVYNGGSVNTVSDILSGEAPCMAVAFYDQYLVVATSGVDIQFFTFDSSGVYYTRSIQLDTSSSVLCLDKLRN